MHRWAIAIQGRFVVGGTVDPGTHSRVRVEHSVTSVFVAFTARHGGDGSAGGPRVMFGGRATFLDLHPKGARAWAGVGGYLGGGVGGGPVYDTASVWPFVEAGLTIELGGTDRAAPPE